MKAYVFSQQVLTSGFSRSKAVGGKVDSTISGPVSAYFTSHAPISDFLRSLTHPPTNNP